MPIHYIKGDLFTAPDDEILLHAVNCQGVWGGGIAKEFAIRFPRAYAAYKEDCHYHSIGEWSNNYRIYWLYTSLGYGNNKDPAAKIIQNTHSAVSRMLFDLNGLDITINSPKINSGLFNVPWENTEAVINDALKWYPNIIWNVWEL